MYKIIGADGKEYGPVTADQLRQWIAERRAVAGTLAAAEGMTEWKPLDSFPEFSIPPAPLTPIAPAILAAPPMRRSNGFGVSAMVLGILSIPAACCCFGVPFNLLGLIFSIIALVQIHGEPDRYEGNGMAIAGLVLSILSILLALVLFINHFTGDFAE